MEQHGKVSDKFPAGPWSSQFTRLRVPNIYNLRTDPFERGTDSQLYAEWFMHRVFLFVPCAGSCRAVAAELQRVPHPPKARELQRR